MEPLVDAIRAAQEFHPEIIRAAPQSCYASRMASTAVPNMCDKVTSTSYYKYSGCGLLRRLVASESASGYYKCNM
jgi:hypothetical protein